MGKFNDIRPGVYAEFTKDLCESLQWGSGTQSHTVHKLVGIEPFAAAALFFRVFVSFVALQRDVFEIDKVGFALGGACVATWLALIGFAVLFGYALRTLAGAYLRTYTARSVVRQRRTARVAANHKTHKVA